MILDSSERATTTAAQLLQDWFVAARPNATAALSQIDDARARGRITREEYLSLLDAWPEEASALDDGDV